MRNLRYLSYLLLSTTAAVIAQLPVAIVDNGVFTGTTTLLPSATAVVNKFLGVPFAQTPPKRFRPPVAAAVSNDAIDAGAYGNACIQSFTSQFEETIFNTPAVNESEDCLYLNVYAPSTPAGGTGRAVIFWIYGGNFAQGTAGRSLYDGSSFAAFEDIILVAANYRTNVFGFPSSPELARTHRNLGLMDQRLALDWVQRNIHAFGGDPTKVTLAGQSAGADSVDALVTSYTSSLTPPFWAAILQSGQFSYKHTPQSKNAPLLAQASRKESWEELTTALHCPGKHDTNLTCVAAADASRIKDIVEQNDLSFLPIVDNVTLLPGLITRRATGQVANIPVLIGSDAQDGRLFTYGTTNLTKFFNKHTEIHGDLVANITAAYSPGSALDVSGAFYTDYVFGCPAAMYANASAAAGMPTWRYYFNASFDNTRFAQYPGLGVYHSSEIPIVFGTYGAENADAQEYALSVYMRSAWARFARDPFAGPGWDMVVARHETLLENDAYSNVVHGSVDESPSHGNVGILGNVGDVDGGGVTVVDQSLIDSSCRLYIDLYEEYNGGLVPQSEEVQSAV